MKIRIPNAGIRSGKVFWECVGRDCLCPASFWAIFCFFDGLVVMVFQDADAVFEFIFGFDFFSGGESHIASEGIVFEEEEKFLSDLIGGMFLDEKAGFFVVDDFGDTAVISADDGDESCACFFCDEDSAFAVAV